MHKAMGRRLTGDFGKGFLTSGLFRYSRHPNFFAGAPRPVQCIVREEFVDECSAMGGGKVSRSQEH